MKTTHWLGIGVFAVLVMGLLNANLATSFSKVARADADSVVKNATQPVEDDMHEFMEYVFQPTYNRLKTAMAKEPTDNNTWKAIKSDALILAEGGNLLLMRKPDRHADVWDEHSVVVRKLGGKLYQAAKKKDYRAARGSYTSMLMKCNSCHRAFADGEHQLEP